jgi:hypothetical protein
MTRACCQGSSLSSNPSPHRHSHRPSHHPSRPSSRQAGSALGALGGRARMIGHAGIPVILKSAQRAVSCSTPKSPSAGSPPMRERGSARAPGRKRDDQHCHSTWVASQPSWTSARGARNLRRRGPTAAEWCWATRWVPCPGALRGRCRGASCWAVRTGRRCSESRHAPSCGVGPGCCRRWG